MRDDDIQLRERFSGPGGQESWLWSSADYLDKLYGNGLILRAVVCACPDGTWQWSVSSLDGDRGELICIGIARSAAGARATAASEMRKCLESAWN